MNATSFAPDRLCYGGDYNPEQWPEHVWDEDVRLMQKAGVNCVSLGVFAWAELEPADGDFRFQWMDRVLDKLHAAGVAVNLATPSGALPRWLTAKHPDTLPVQANRQRMTHGYRHRLCPASPALREHVARIDAKLAQRYADHPAVVAWHLSNEVTPTCWCDGCAAMFRDWLRRRYHDIDTLNQQWWTRFWSHRYDSFDQVEPPYPTADVVPIALHLDWRRFRAHALADFIAFEKQILRDNGATQPATVNLMYGHPDCHNPSMADTAEFTSWDAYPQPHEDPLHTSTAHAFMRGLRDGDPWLLIEQATSWTNWWPYARSKSPGQYRRESWQAVAHGSQGAMCFQWRQSRGSFEKFHAAMIHHCGHEKSRIFAECAELGAEMNALAPRILETTVPRATIAVISDTDSEWALSHSAGPGKHKPVLHNPSGDAAAINTLHEHALALRREGYAADIVRTDGDWSGYDLIIAPALYMTATGRFPRTPADRDRPTDVNAKIAHHVRNGGAFLATYLTGYVNENDLVHEGGAPGPLRDVLGLTVEDLDNAPPGERANAITPDPDALPGLEGPLACDHYFELPILEGAAPLATYAKSWYAGRPALTVNAFGSGEAFYLATQLEPDPLRRLLAAIAARRRLQPLAPPSDGVEVCQRTGPNGLLLFILNHTDEPKSQTLPAGAWRDLASQNPCDARVGLPAQGVRILASQ